MKIFDLSGLKKALVDQPLYPAMLAEMATDTHRFFVNFHDDPALQSEWGHHYFCKADGGLLKFNLEKPHRHLCPICQTEYESLLLDGVWVYFYRNQVVINLWKAAILYQTTRKAEYLSIVRKMIDFYGKRYKEFTLHNKEQETFATLSSAKWGCGRIMPQGLNESIFIIRMLIALEIVKPKLSNEQLSVIDSMCQEIFAMLKPQIDKVHNISVWYGCAIAVMGLFTRNSEMISTAFEGEYGLYRQIKEGVTKDFFWFEGSIHYNFFTLEAIMNALLFAKVYRYPLPHSFTGVIKKMLINGYEYAFANHVLPNPNDGWPNINLKTYGYVYDIAAKVFGTKSKIGLLDQNIVSGFLPRTELPLSRPYYFQKETSLERLMLLPSMATTPSEIIIAAPHDFKNSQFAILRNEHFNVFLKYGHNGPSHAHPDKMAIEVMVDNLMLSRDLSNAGYGSKLCNEWHRMSASHSTVVIDGKNQISMRQGKTIHFRPDYIKARALDVYRDPELKLSRMKQSMNHDEILKYLMRYLSLSETEALQAASQPERLQAFWDEATKRQPVVNYTRTIKLTPQGFQDCFEVDSDRMVTMDYFFHSEAKLISNLNLKAAELEFDDFGYQHIQNVNLVRDRNKKITLQWQLGKRYLESIIHLPENAKLFIMKTLNNPVDSTRDTFMVRCLSTKASFRVEWNLVSKGENHG